MTQTTIDIQTAATLLGVTGQRVRMLCAAGKLVGARKDGRLWRIPRTAHPKFVDTSGTDTRLGTANLDQLPPHKRDAALRKLSIVQACETFCGASVRSGFGRNRAIDAYAVQTGIGKRSLQRWVAAYRANGLMGLVDTRGGGGGDSDILSPAAWDYFLSLYLNLKQPTAKQCYDVTCFVNSREDRGWNIPSLAYLYKYIDRCLPMPVAVLHREGLDAYEAKCAPYIIKDITSIEPGAIWVGDHHMFNCWVRHRGTWVRPWITAWADMRSRTMMGWYITASPNQTTILQAFRDGVEKYGPPESVKIDNGKDYDSEMWTGVTKKQRRALSKGYIDEQNVAGLYALMNISVSFAIPYNAKAKPVERWFDTQDKQFTKTIPTYCGKDSARKPESLNDYLKSDRAIAEAMSMEEFAEMTAQYIDVYNNSAHTGDGMDGQSPMQVLSQRPSRRVIGADALELLCQVWTRPQKIGKNGVKVNKLWYGQYDPQLLMLQGQEVRCAYDPDNMQRVRIYDAQTYHYIATAEQATMVAYGTEVAEADVREGMRQNTRAKRLVKQYKPAAKIANTELTHLAIAAAAARTEPAPEITTPAIRPVATVLDGQAKAVRRTERMRSVRRAAGAENTTHVPELTLEFDTPDPTVGVELDFDFQSKPKKEHLKLSLFDG